MSTPEDPVDPSDHDPDGVYDCGGACPEEGLEVDPGSKGESSHVPTVNTELRGSMLLLGGRVVAIGLNFLVQVMMVRFLTRGQYGSFSFAISATALAANLNMLGLARSMSRFGPLYGERKDTTHLVQAILAALGTILAVGGLVVAGAFLFNGAWQPFLTEDALSQELLVLLIALTPLTAIDAVLEVLAAAFAGARAIFLRRHLLTPILRLGAVVAVMLLGKGPKTLAICYQVAALVGILAYILILTKALRKRGVRWSMPNLGAAKPVLGYGMSMLLLDFAGVSVLHLPAVFLEHFRGASEVAGLRAVAPLATLVLVVFQSMKLLYVPLATRSLERGGRAELTHAYWSTAQWIGLLSFPIFALCVFLSPLAVVLLFGERYEDASALAAIMSVGYYMHAILGVNTLTLQALGESRSLRTVAIAGITTGVVANLLLVPSFGAVGAALATTLTLLAHDLTNAFLVWRKGQVAGPPKGFFKPYCWALGVSIGLLFCVTLAQPNRWVALALVLGGVAIVWQAARQSLNLLSTFPELARIPGLRRILS